VNKLPVNLNARDVRVMLLGRKTEIRRVCEPPPDEDSASVATGISERTGAPYWKWEPRDRSTKGYMCPFGQIGDQLFVREEWGVRTRCGGGPGSNYPGQWLGIVYRADVDSMDDVAPEQVRYVKTDPAGFDYWRDPSRWQQWQSEWQMPQWASRITLEIEDVSLQRIQQITGNPDYAAAEMGWEECTPGTIDFWIDPSNKSWDRHPDEDFPAWWDATYGHVAGWDWASDPFVWRLVVKVTGEPVQMGPRE